MPYLLQTDDAVRQYLRNLEGLTRKDRVRLSAAITFDLREDAEGLVTNHLQSPGADPRFAWWQIDFHADDSRVRRLGFVVDVSAAAAGVLTLVYAEEIE